jgi:hypothetical protein
VITQDIASSQVAIAQIQSFSHSGAEAGNVDTTALDSGVGNELTVHGHATGGTFDMEMFFDSELVGHQALTDELNNPRLRAYGLTLTGGTAITFNAAGLSFGFSGEVAGVNTASVSLPISGLMVYPT